MDNEPRLRAARRAGAGYACGKIKRTTVYAIARELAYIFATKKEFSVEGKEWEQIFARCISGVWDKSNNKLEDVTRGRTAWSAKTVSATHKDIHDQVVVNLISGRNSTTFSYDIPYTKDSDPAEAGDKIIKIWNKGVSDGSALYSDFRTVVLVKGKAPNVNQFALFEVPTIQYEPANFDYQWNTNDVLEIVDKASHEVKMKWQPSGSQFTIIETVPDTVVFFSIEAPGCMTQDDVLSSVGFTDGKTTIERKQHKQV